ncbi:hypothetical protein BJF82_11505 [Kytococcus sp. CUA-901]|nr:hypothetical protein BJF82_11505 [Kytococcus sp. CUA-901]
MGLGDQPLQVLGGERSSILTEFRDGVQEGFDGLISVFDRDPSGISRPRRHNDLSHPTLAQRCTVTCRPAHIRPEPGQERSG